MVTILVIFDWLSWVLSRKRTEIHAIKETPSQNSIILCELARGYSKRLLNY